MSKKTIKIVIQDNEHDTDASIEAINNFPEDFWPDVEFVSESFNPDEVIHSLGSLDLKVDQMFLFARDFSTEQAALLAIHIHNTHFAPNSVHIVRLYQDQGKNSSLQKHPEFSDKVLQYANAPLEKNIVQFTAEMLYEIEPEVVINKIKKDIEQKLDSAIDNLKPWRLGFFGSRFEINGVKVPKGIHDIYELVKEGPKEWPDDNRAMIDQVHDITEARTHKAWPKWIKNLWNFFRAITGRYRSSETSETYDLFDDITIHQAPGG